MQSVRPKKRRIGRRPILDSKTQTLIPSEYQECKAFYYYCQRILKLGKTIVKNVNEGIRDTWYTQALLNIGLTPGHLDYQYIVPNDKYSSLWLEMKRIDGRSKKTDANQDEMIELLNKNGHYACYAYGAEHAIKIYNDYVNNRL